MIQLKKLFQIQQKRFIRNNWFNLIKEDVIKYFRVEHLFRSESGLHQINGHKRHAHFLKHAASPALLLFVIGISAQSLWDADARFLLFEFAHVLHQLQVFLLLLQFFFVQIFFGLLLRNHDKLLIIVFGFSQEFLFFVLLAFSFFVIGVRSFAV